MSTAQLATYISQKDTTFAVVKINSPTGVFEKVDYNLDAYKELFEFFQSTFGEITIPKNTLIFHSNQFFSEELNKFEPIGSLMKIQDIRKYGNKGTFTTYKYPFSQMMARVYANFSPAGNTKVAGNRSVAESVYATTEELYFLQLPFVDGFGHMKSVFKIENSRIFKEYIEYKNQNPDGKKYCGFILSTTTDETDVLDTDATYIEERRGSYVYPEILILDGFDKFQKKAQYDIYQPFDKKFSTIDIVHWLVDPDPRTGALPDEGGITKKTIDEQKAEYSSLGPFKDSIGKFGTRDLLAYKVPEAPKPISAAVTSSQRLIFPPDFFSRTITIAAAPKTVPVETPATDIFGRTVTNPLGGSQLATVQVRRMGGAASLYLQPITVPPLPPQPPFPPSPPKPAPPPPILVPLVPDDFDMGVFRKIPINPTSGWITKDVVKHFYKQAEFVLAFRKGQRFVDKQATFNRLLRMFEFIISNYKITTEEFLEKYSILDSFIQSFTPEMREEIDFDKFFYTFYTNSVKLPENERKENDYLRIGKSIGASVVNQSNVNDLNLKINNIVIELLNYVAGLDLSGSPRYDIEKGIMEIREKLANELDHKIADTRRHVRDVRAGTLQKLESELEIIRESITNVTNVRVKATRLQRIDQLEKEIDRIKRSHRFEEKEKEVGEIETLIDTLRYSRELSDLTYTTGYRYSRSTPRYVVSATSVGGGGATGGAGGKTFVPTPTSSAVGATGSAAGPPTPAIPAVVKDEGGTCTIS